MSRRRNKRIKTFQQRQTERQQRQQEEQQELDILLREMASNYRCSTKLARDLAVQCFKRLEDLAFDMDCSRAALDFWSPEPRGAAPVVGVFRDLVAEHERHADTITDLHHRLIAFSRDPAVHQDLGLPVSYYQNQLRLRLFHELGMPSIDDGTRRDDGHGAAAPEGIHHAALARATRGGIHTVAAPKGS